MNIVPDSFFVIAPLARQREVPRICRVASVAQGMDVLERGVSATQVSDEELGVTVNALSHPMWMIGSFGIDQVKRVVAGDHAQHCL